MSLNTEYREELLLVSTGFLGACWLFLRAKGGAGGVFFGVSATPGRSNRSLNATSSIAGDFMLGVSEPTLRLLGRDSELMKLSNLAVGPCNTTGSLIGFPRLLFGGGGLSPLSEIVPRPARYAFASLPSSSSDVRGLSSCAGWTVSKIECCEIDAVSALEPLSLTGIGPAGVFCTTEGPRSPVSSILLNASTSRVDLDVPVGSLTPAASWLLTGRLGVLANRPKVSLTALSFAPVGTNRAGVVISLLVLAFSSAFSMAPSSSSEASGPKGSLASAWL
jgi:hypothetical protein